jgi:ligand-binding sensor domain-containing protein
VYYIPENNIASGWVSSIAVDKFGNKWFGTIDGGLRKFDGTTWTIYTPYNSGLPDFSITAVGINPVNNDIWVGINNRGVGRLSNGQWTLYDTINSPLKSTRITGFTFDKSGNVWIATRPAGRDASLYPYPSEAFYGGVYKFDGTNFTWYYTKNSPLPSEGVQSITTDKNGNIWLGTAYRDFLTNPAKLTGGVVKISGNSWAVYDTSNGFPSIWTWRVAVDDSGNAWIGTYGKGLVKFDGQNTTVYNRSNSGLPGDTVYSIAIDASGVIWATTNKGVVKFDRNQWSVFNSSNTGMPIDQAKFVMIDKQGNKWFLSGWWGDRVVVYREGGVILDVEQVADVIPSSFKLYQNYPNPFNPMTTIEFEIPEKASVKLIVYDILGREVGKLVDKELEPGRYKVNFDASELSSGVYFYRLEAGKFADVKKMLLVK